MACLKFLLITFLLYKQSTSQNIKSITMFVNMTCFPFLSAITINIHKCQIVCLGATSCYAATYHHLTFLCELYSDDTLYYNANMSTDSYSTSMIGMTGTRIPLSKLQIQHLLKKKFPC